jgi:hypothetical protein
MRKMRDDDELFCELWRLCAVQLTIDPIVFVQLHALGITLFTFSSSKVLSHLVVRRHLSRALNEKALKKSMVR